MNVQKLVALYSQRYGRAAAQRLALKLHGNDRAAPARSRRDRPQLPLMGRFLSGGRSAPQPPLLIQRSGPGGHLSSEGSGPLINRNAGDAVAAGVASLLDKEARGVLSDIPGGTAALNAVEGFVGGVLAPQYSGYLTPEQNQMVTNLAATDPVGASQLLQRLSGAAGTKQIYDPMSPSGYRVVGAGSRGGPGFTDAFEGD